MVSSGAQATGVYGLPVLESPSRDPGVPGLLPCGLSPGRADAVSPLSPHVAVPLCVCVLTSPAHEDTSPAGSGPPQGPRLT